MNCLNENLVIVIPARKNSKRLKNKNFKDFHGFPLFEWSIAAGLFLKHQLGGSRKISVICSSDDHQILDLIKKKYISNVYAIQRSAKLSDDKAILSDVIIDCIHRLADEGMICVDDYLGGSFILLQPTSPIRLKNDLVNFCSQIRDLGDYHSVVSVNRRYKVIKDVYKIINKGEVNSDFSIGFIGQKLITWKDIENNNTAFVDGSLYSGSVSMLKEKGFMPEAKTLAFPLSIDNSIDIDTEEEFKDALLLIKKLKELGIEYVKPRI
ncbi:MAG: cytidylyltransferase domain-containing protein [Paracoccaceae bacterium]|tara:strand:- start:2141 stop:2938 length:798 start_codon:yes stop_codon:yes gene_type:complete